MSESACTDSLVSDGSRSSARVIRHKCSHCNLLGKRGLVYELRGLLVLQIQNANVFRSPRSKRESSSVEAYMSRAISRLTTMQVHVYSLVPYPFTKRRSLGQFWWVPFVTKVRNVGAIISWYVYALDAIRSWSFCICTIQWLGECPRLRPEQCHLYNV